jgi:ABC-2 type transport system permease protein
MIEKIIPIVIKEFKELRRDKLTVIVIIFVPSLLLFIYGYAISLDVKEVKLVICDYDNSIDSRDFLNSLAASHYFKIVNAVRSESEIDEYLVKRRAWAGLIIDHNFSKNLRTGKGARVMIVLDGSNGYTTQTVIGYFHGGLSQYQNKLAGEYRLRTGRIVPLINIEHRIWYNPLIESSYSLVPGLIAFVMMIVAVIATTLSVVREKETGTYEQMLITPVSSQHILIGKMIPYFLMSIIASALMVLIAYYLLNIPFRGSVIFFAIASVLFLFGALGLGLIISAIAKSQQVAFMIAVLITMLPTIILSNFIFPISSMPMIIQWITYIVPAKYFIAITRAIMLKDAGFFQLWQNYVALIIFACLMLLLGIKKFKK